MSPQLRPTRTRLVTAALAAAAALALTTPAHALPGNDWPTASAPTTSAPTTSAPTLAAPTYDARTVGPVERVRRHTARFRHPGPARAAGYTLLRDAAGIACIDDPAGGMGVHLVDGDNVGDARVRADRPEALVYEPTRRGKRLVAVEYVVLRQDWRARHRTGRPALFGHRFELQGADNRYGLPPFFELHLWAWKHNPEGLFDDWNPRVHCPGR